MKINLDFKLKDLDGTVTETTAGKLLANILAGSSEGDALKLFHWATKLWAGEELDLDPSDTTTLIEFVKKQQTMNNLAKAQILEKLK